jgi:hypothetical protein
MASIELQ